MITKIISIFTLLGFTFGIYFYIDSHYAKCADVKIIEQRLDYKIESDKLITTQERLWKLEDRFGSDPDKIQDQVMRQRMKELKSEIEIQRERVKKLEGR